MILRGLVWLFLFIVTITSCEKVKQITEIKYPYSARTIPFTELKDSLNHSRYKDSCAEKVYQDVLVEILPKKLEFDTSHNCILCLDFGGNIYRGRPKKKMLIDSVPYCRDSAKAEIYHSISVKLIDSTLGKVLVWENDQMYNLFKDGISNVKLRLKGKEALELGESNLDVLTNKNWILE